jgi:hypothetical protein
MLTVTPTPSLRNNNTTNFNSCVFLLISHFFALLRTLRSLLMLRHFRFRPWPSSSASALLSVSESARGLPTLVVELLEAVLAVVGDSHGSGSCMARKPETKHPPYACSASNDAALLRAMSRIAASSNSSQSSTLYR